MIVKCDHELVDVTWTRYEAGEVGPDPHVHEQHADAWYVLEGELTFGLGPGGEELRRAPAGAFVLVPAGVIHTFRNEGPAHGPFPQHPRAEHGIRGIAPALPARASGGTRSTRRTTGGARLARRDRARPGEGESIMGGAVVFKAQVGDGDGTFSLTEITLPAGLSRPRPRTGTSGRSTRSTCSRGR